MKSKLLLAFLSLFCFNTAFASGSGTGDQQVEAVEITSLDNLRIKLVGEKHQSTCASTAYRKQMVVPKADPNFDHFLSIALTALSTGKRVYFWLDNDSCVTEYSNVYPRPMTISLRNY